MTSFQDTMLWAFIFVLVGATSYITDRTIGVKLYGKIRKWWHPPSSEQADPVKRGFIYNRSNKVRWHWAAVVSTIQAFIMIGFRHADPRVELMLFFVITPATYVGFLVGPYYEKLKKIREKGFDAVDRVESGQLNIGEEVREAYAKKKKMLNTFLNGLAVSFSNWWSGLFPQSTSKEKASVSVPPASASASEPDEDAEAVRRSRERIKELNKKK